MVLEEFTPLNISTMTATTKLKCSLNVIDIAKYLELDEHIIGVKLIYAAGQSSIIRGYAKLSKKKKDFYNQVTILIRMGNDLTSFLISCKIFHNSTLHITGAHDINEIKDAYYLLVNAIKKIDITKIIVIQPNEKYLISMDNLIYSINGKIIGWKNTEKDLLFISGEYVEFISDKNQFISKKYIDNKKLIFDLNGKQIGIKELKLINKHYRYHFEVRNGYVYSGNKIVGKEEIEIEQENSEEIEKVSYYRNMYITNGAIIRKYKGIIEEYSSIINDDDITIHMINTYFKAPFMICTSKLHRFFKECSYYSRFDPASNAAVNLRFHYKESDIETEKFGKCSLFGQSICECKQISVSCFNSGKINITGLLNKSQGQNVYNFLVNFFKKNKEKISV